jgi:triosephosphate isomerase (TIM)
VYDVYDVDVSASAGHSERRTLFNEDSACVALKTRSAIDASLSVILCVGETLQQREAGETAKVVETQLAPVISTIKESEWRFVCRFYLPNNASHELTLRILYSKIVIAYEPVWAIGTGKVATPNQAQEAHADIRSFLTKAVSPTVAEQTRIIYGGSVTAANCRILGMFCCHVSLFLLV